MQSDTVLCCSSYIISTGWKRKGLGIHRRVCKSLKLLQGVLIQLNHTGVKLSGNVTDRDLEIDRDMEHESDSDYPLINKRYLNNKPSN